MATKFALYTDPGHGWAKVPRNLLHTLNIADRITSYSFQHGDYVYLEEDCDLGTFARAYDEQYGSFPHFEVKHTDKASKLRSYRPYVKTT